MNIRKIFVGLAVTSAIAVPSVALAQQGTVVTSSGERVFGHIRDMDKGGYTVLVGGSERRIMIPDIAVVEFASARNPNGDELNRLRDGRQLVILKDGTALVGNITEYERTAQGSLADLPMDHAFRVRFQGDGAERNFLSSEVAKIFFRAPAGTTGTGGTGQAAPPPVAGSGGREIVVRSDQQWTPTGIAVRRGQTVTISASGRVQLTNDTNDVAETGGSVSGRMAPDSPLPRVPAGALIGRVGNGAPFLIGNQTSVQMLATGQLFLGINDDGFSDNSGQFVVTVTSDGRIRR